MKAVINTQALNTVKVENTFRIRAENAIEAVKASITVNYDSVKVSPVVLAGFENVFIVKSTIKDSVFYSVAFVEVVGNGSFRVEVGSPLQRLEEIDACWFTGGDAEVNKQSFHLFSMGNTVSVIAWAEYEAELGHWATKDATEGGNMPEFFINHNTLIEVKNGVLIK